MAKTGELFERGSPDWTLAHDQFYVGTAGWSYPDWDGPFYAPATPSKDRLPQYAAEFRSVEIDSTFYGIPARRTVQSWRRRAPEGFVFAAKFPRRITHDCALAGCADQAATFVDVMTELGGHLGPLLIQLPPRFGVDQFDRLARFLEGLPDGLMYAVEVRHRSWLTDAFSELLERWQVAMTLTCGRHLGRFWRATSRIAYVRWLGGHDDYDTYGAVQGDRSDEIGWWAPRIAHFLDRGGTVFGYAANDYQGFAPHTARQVHEQVETSLSS